MDTLLFRKQLFLEHARQHWATPIWVLITKRKPALCFSNSKKHGPALGNAAVLLLGYGTRNTKNKLPKKGATKL